MFYFNLIQDKDLINKYSSYGPIFGGSKGGDIFLANRRNEDSDTGAIFPMAYDYEDPIVER